MHEDSPFASFPARFYLEKHYAQVDVENAAFMGAIARAVRPAGQLGTVVELGGGPSLCGLLAMTAATTAGPRRVVWVDAAASSLAEVRAWLSEDRSAFDYAAIEAWIEQTLGADPHAAAARLRAAQWDLRQADLRNGLPDDLRGAGDVVGSYFLAEAAASDETGFVELTQRIADAAAEQATVVLGYIRHSRPYRLDGEALYPAFSVDEDALPRLLDAAGLRFAELRVETGPMDDPPARPGYDGMVFASGRLAARGYSVSNADGTNR